MKLQLLAAVSQISDNSLTFTSIETGSICLSGNSSFQTLQYNIGNGWQKYTPCTYISVLTGNKIKFRNTADTLSQYNSYFQFIMTGKFKSSGNVMSLLNYSNKCTDYCFCKLFYNCSNLLTAPELPATTLANYCYQNMFSDCTSLITVPELSATNLNNGCYYQMFYRCTGLTTAPKLPATTLTTSCYRNMFSGCTSLSSAPILPATTLANYCYSNMFSYCYSLSAAPELPATTLSSNCYSYMFFGCTSLTIAPILSTTNLANGCYLGMFSDCSSLISAPELPATILADYCYLYMFYNCTSLSATPELPATILTDSCYFSMFNGCTSLNAAPELPAITLADSCYQSMFCGCSNLSSAPELPAITLALYCYLYMFSECSNLTTAPELPATNLVDSCYRNMFDNCNNLNTVSAYFKEWNLKNTYNWLNMTAISGNFYSLANKNITRSTSTIPNNWNYYYAKEPLTFTSVTAKSAIAILEDHPTLYFNIQYKLNDNDWTNYNIGDIIPLTNINDKVSFKSTNFINNPNHYGYFAITGFVKGSGCVNSLTDNTTILSAYNYCNLFYSCSGLLEAPELPVINLAQGCYQDMFNCCTSLSAAPELPATNLADSCYNEMFYGCTALSTAPELPSSSFTKFNYYMMFSQCTNLNYIKVNFSSWLNTQEFWCTQDWLSNVSSSGTFVKPEKLEELYGTSYIPNNWTVINY